MRIHDVQQGSQRWLELRMGIPSASNCDRIITPGAAPSKSASGYCNELIAEILLGRPLLGVLTGAMERGKGLEDEARKYYELVRDVETVPIGFVTTDDGRLGASPDRLVGEVGLVEIKAPSETTQSKYLSAHIDAMLGSGSGEGGAATVYKCQVQMQLFVCEREWCDVISYFPGLPETITRVGRDEKFIATMRTLLYDFVALFDSRLEKLKALGYLDGVPAKPKEEEPTAFGLTEADVEQYVASLKAKGVLPAGQSNG